LAALERHGDPHPLPAFRPAGSARILVVTAGILAIASGLACRGQSS